MNGSPPPPSIFFFFGILAQIYAFEGNAVNFETENEWQFNEQQQPQS
jgi:hypothetical protein